MKLLWRVLLPLVILAAGAAAAVALIKTRPGPQSVTADEKAWIVTTETVEPQSTAPTLTLYGRVESPHVAQLSAAVSADVESVRVAEGEEVAAGQPLVVLDDRESVLLLRQREAEVADVRAQITIENQRYQNDQRTLEHEQRLLELSAKAVERARDLVARNVGSRSQLDQSRQAEARQIMALEAHKLAIRGHESRVAQLRARQARAEALRDRAALDVQRTRVKAPFAGRVTEVLVSPGDRVRGGDPLLSLLDTSAIQIRAQIPTRYLPVVLASLASGERPLAVATVDGRRLLASLGRLAGQVDTGSGGVDGLFSVTQGGAWLQLGRTVELVLSLPPREGVVSLPLEAIYGTDRVFKLEGERLRGVTVQRLGEVRSADGETRALVRSPELRARDRVVTTQLPNALDGLRVRVAGATR